MRSLPHPINLQFGKSGPSRPLSSELGPHPAPFAAMDSLDQIIPSSRGSHSETSGT